MREDFSFSRSLKLAQSLRDFALIDGADGTQADDLFKSALSCGPLMFWLVDRSEAPCAAQCVYSFSRVGGGIMGLGAMALSWRSAPMRSRSALFPMLWPRRHDVVLFWDEVARVRWLRPCLDRMELAGELHALIGHAPTDLEAAAQEWRVAHGQAWRERGARAV